MESETIPNCFYRISIKALVLDETRTKFLIVQEKSGKWEFPGGGLNWGELPEQCLRRELDEEMGIVPRTIASQPSYVMTGKRDDGKWAAYIFYETMLNNFEFKPSCECVALKFVSPEEVRNMDIFISVKHFAEIFVPAI